MRSPGNGQRQAEMRRHSERSEESQRYRLAEILRRVAPQNDGVSGGDRALKHEKPADLRRAFFSL